NGAEPPAEIERLRRPIRLPHLQEHLLHIPATKGREPGLEQRARDAASPELWSHGEIEHLSSTSDLPPDHVTHGPPPRLGYETERPGRREPLVKARLGPGIGEGPPLDREQGLRVSGNCRPNSVRSVHAPSPNVPAPRRACRIPVPIRRVRRPP